MKYKRGMLLAAGLLAGAAALTGCTAQTTPVVTPTPAAAQKETADPVTVAPEQPETTPDSTAGAGGEETPGPIMLRVDGEELAVHALEENEKLLLPLTQTAAVLGWSVEEESVEEETQMRRSVVLSKDESRISVSWVSSDNTARSITWQKDGLLIPVDPMITTVEDTVYVPAAFFEEAMEARIEKSKNEVTLTTPQPSGTAETQPQEDATAGG